MPTIQSQARTSFALLAPGQPELERFGIRAVQAIQAIGETISRVNHIAAAIAAAVEQQGAATQEIARNVQQAAAGTTEVSGHIASVSQAAGETGAAAGEVLGSAKGLVQLSEALRDNVDRFIGNIRAA